MITLEFLITSLIVVLIPGTGVIMLTTFSEDEHIARARRVLEEHRSAVEVIIWQGERQVGALSAVSDPAYDVAAHRARAGAEVAWQPWSPETFARAGLHAMGEEESARFLLELEALANRGTGVHQQADAPRRAVAVDDRQAPADLTYAWSFGDGRTSSAQNPTYSYAAAGTFTESGCGTEGGTSPGSTLTRA